MIKQHKSKSLTSNYKKSSFVSKIMVCQSDSGGKVCKTQRYEFPGTLVEFKAEIYSSPINGNQRISSGRQSVSSRPQRLDI